VEEMEWLLIIHGLKSVREECIPRDWQEIENYNIQTTRLGNNN
jgi:hypothetical protein